MLLCVRRLIQGDTKTPPSDQAPAPAEPDQEELDFLFDEEMEQMAPRKNQFTDWSDEDNSDYELDDQDVNKILIVTQTPPHMRKHPSGDRTGNHESRAKLTTDLAKAINDGLYYYEQDLWTGEEQIEGIKVRKTWKQIGHKKMKMNCDGSRNTTRSSVSFQRLMSWAVVIILLFSVSSFPWNTDHGVKK